MKDKHSSEVIYALADYKQLVLTYRTKHAEMIKSLTFWKTSVVWLAVLSSVIFLALLFWAMENSKNIDNNKKSSEMLNAQINAVTEKLASTEQDLTATRDELRRKEELVNLLEKNISTTSKKLLEKLLSEQEETGTAK